MLHLRVAMQATHGMGSRVFGDIARYGSVCNWDLVFGDQVVPPKCQTELSFIVATPEGSKSDSMWVWVWKGTHR